MSALRVSTYVIPTEEPESDGTLEWSATTLVVVELEAGGCAGLGYTYADKATAELVDEVLRKVVMGGDVLDGPALFSAMARAVRNHGFPGVAAMAISAVDAALWDAKARLLGVPLAKLLGAERDAAPVYGSGGFTSYSIDRLCEQLAGWVGDGIPRVKMKIGRDPSADVERVRAARAAIGPEPELFVDANGAYERKQALELARRFADLGVTWLEEPVSSDDLAGLRLARNRAPAPIRVAAGEYGYRGVYFMRMLAAGAVDVLQADASRCGGPTGFLRVGALCDAWQVPLSAHCAPALHLHACLAAPRLLNLEYFHDHARIEQMLFDGAAHPVAGELRADLTRPGLGLALKRKDAERFAA
ncbi:MAG TPA: enolase C-terminal domain-like protein [Polyangia bacterium]|nr:enolase C-terminal domain-like protein [Polyangia bacterium]